MSPSRVLLAGFLLCSAFVDAKDISRSTYTQEECITFIGTQSRKSVPTTTHSTLVTSTVVARKTVHPRTTVTPGPDTSTSTVFETSTSTSTLSQSTDTFTSTSTAFETTTSTATSTFSTTSFTDTTTTTTETTTSTVPTQAGFTPLATVLQEEGVTASKKKRAADSAIQFPRRNHGVTLPLEPRAATCKKKAHGHRPKFYPQRVKCEKFVEVISFKTNTQTAKNTRTVTACPSTVTSTITSTAIVTSTTMLDDASTTVTESTTSTISTDTTNVVTSSATSTNTVVVPITSTATTYAACATNNIISQINGNYIDSTLVYINGLIDTVANSPYDCCVQCQNTQNCAIWNTIDTDCELSFQNGGPAVCSPGQQAGDLTANIDRQGFVAGNGNCGTFTYNMPF